MGQECLAGAGAELVRASSTGLLRCSGNGNYLLWRPGVAGVSSSSKGAALDV
jgi:hypothetical protein